jgi:hypothetical protein
MVTGKILPWTAFVHGAWENGGVKKENAEFRIQNSEWINHEICEISEPRMGKIEQEETEKTEIGRRRAGGRHSDGKKVENGVLERGWRHVLAENGCAQLHVFTRIYTNIHKVVFINVTSAKSGSGRQNLPIWVWRRGSFRVQGAAFRRLLPPFAAFSDGGGGGSGELKVQS